MKFKASLDREQFAVLFTHFKLLSEQGKAAILILSSDVVRTILREDDAMEVRASLSTASIFDEFNIQSRNRNTIAMELTLANLTHALKAGLGAHSTTLKLTKRGNDPFLCISSTMVEGGVDVLQDVPVRMLLAGETNLYLNSGGAGSGEDGGAGAGEDGDGGAGSVGPLGGLGEIRFKLLFPSPRPVSMVVERMRVLLGSRPGGAAAAVSAVNGNPGAGMLASAGGMRDGSSSGGGASGGGSSGSSGGLIRVEVDAKSKRVVFSIQTETVAVRSFFNNLGGGGGGGGGSGDGAAEDGAAGAGADAGAGGEEDKKPSLATRGSSNSNQKAVVFVSSRHLSKAIKAITNMGSVMGLLITKRRNVVVFGENADRTSSITFLLSMVTAAAALGGGVGEGEDD